MNGAEKVIAVALAEVGYQEKESDRDLDQPGANAGDGNWTKYARDLSRAGYYNGNKNGYEWCDVFVDWCFFQAFGKAEGQRVQCQTGELGAAVPFSAGYYKVQGRYDRTPRPGDQVFFQEKGELVHTGIVAEVTPEEIVTVEGNTGNQVRRRTHARTDSYIAGYGHPKYDGQEGPVPPDPAALEQSTAAWQAWLGVTADGEYGPATRAAAIGRALRGMLNGAPLRLGSSGDAVRVLQGRLYSLRHDPMGLDGRYGAGTAAAVRAYQATVPGLEADGVAGEDTFAAMFEL